MEARPEWEQNLKKRSLNYTQTIDGRVTRAFISIVILNQILSRFPCVDIASVSCITYTTSSAHFIE